MKAKDLRERSPEDLRELEKSIAKDIFQNRFKNFTNRLDDTSAIKKTRRELARVKTLLVQKTAGQTASSSTEAAPPAVVAKAAKPVAAKKAPKAEAKSASSEKPASSEKSGTEKPAKKTAKKTSAKGEAK
jgi:large subunit ribosomal protein L29